MIVRYELSAFDHRLFFQLPTQFAILPVISKNTIADIKCNNELSTLSLLPVQGYSTPTENNNGLNRLRRERY